MATPSARLLVAGDRRYRWRVTRKYEPGQGSHEVLSIWRDGGGAGRLSLVFRAGPERLVAAGGFWFAGGVQLGDALLNLNRPGVVRAFLDVATARGWHGEGERHLDGWDLFAEAAARVSSPRPSRPR